MSSRYNVLEVADKLGATLAVLSNYFSSDIKISGPDSDGFRRVVISELNCLKQLTRELNKIVLDFIRI